MHRVASRRAYRYDRSEMIEVYYSMFPAKKEFFEGMTMLRRMSEAIEVADVVVFYLSPKASCTCSFGAKDHAMTRSDA